MTVRSASHSPLNPDLLALLACCRSAPADDTPRLVLADWLEEHAEVSGLPAAADARNRAALIRVQVELARPSCDAEHRAELRSTEQRLLQAHAEGWLGGLPRRLHELAHPTFGFARNFPTDGKQAFHFHPLAPRNPWRFVRGLLTVRLRADDASDLELGAWFGSPLAAWAEEASVDLAGVAALEELEVADALRPYLAVQYAVGAATFPTLRQPRPEHVELTEQRCRWLLRSTNFGLVRGLTLFGPAFEAGFVRLMAGADVTGVRRVSIRTALTDTQAAFLAAAPLTNLSALDVSGTNLSPDGLRLIANSPHLRQLVSLVAFRNRFASEGLIALAESPLAHTLNALEIQNTGIADRGVSALARSPLMNRLVGPALNLSMNPIADAGVKALAACEHLERFTELILRDCRVSDAGAKALAESPHVANLAYLDLWKNAIGDAGAKALAASPHLEDVRDLSLRDNAITATGARALRARFADRVKV